MVKLIQSLLDKLPYIKSLRHKVDIVERNSHVLPGHFYSPIVDVNDIALRKSKIWPHPMPVDISGIDLQHYNQLGLLRHCLTEYLPEYPFSAEKKNELAYHYNNRYFGFADGLFLYSIIKHFKPQKIVEAGSGFTSALMMDTRKLLGFPHSLTFIDPDLSRVNELIKQTDQAATTVIQSNVEEVNADVLTNLNANDILFIDSSHVCKTGSDVHFLFFDILPKLQSGVIIHIHDIFYPFLYPEKWVLGGINWNEAFLLRALLTNSNRYSILLWPDYFQKVYPNELASLELENDKGAKPYGQSIWLQVN